jgi:hypothetical protein
MFVCMFFVGAANICCADDLGRLAKVILEARCARCHAGPGSSSGYEFDVRQRATMVPGTRASAPIVIPGKPELSTIVRITEGKSMPKRGSPEAELWSDSERKLIREWVLQGAPWPEVALKPRKRLPLAHVYKSMESHLRSAAPEQRPFLRFLVLTHWHNNEQVSDELLNQARLALGKTVNSLSRMREIVPTVAIDKENTVFVLDLRSIGWNQKRGDSPDVWSRMVRGYPYGLSFDNHTDADLKLASQAVSQMLPAEGVPWVLADWFVATTIRPPLYHVILNMPSTVTELEQELGVDAGANLLADQVKRAGFVKSGVSAQNRLVERHETKSGGYWKSYDFLADNPRANLIRFPLGPETIGLNANLAFKQDGGEMIFSLPNGLQAYFLADARGKRLDFGPIQVVGDNDRISGTHEIVNGVSCIACHRNGIIQVKDTIRDVNVLAGAQRERLLRWHPKSEVMKGQIEADQRRFADALNAVYKGVSGGAMPDSEPISTVVARYSRELLDINMVESELFLAPGKLKESLGEAGIKKLGLDFLATGNGMGRYLWEASSEGGESLMQSVGRELKYTPITIR